AVVVRMRVDETRCEMRAASVDLALAPSCAVEGRATDARDAVAFDRDVGLKRGAAAAVEHADVSDHEIAHPICSVQNASMSVRNRSGSPGRLPMCAPRLP